MVHLHRDYGSVSPLGSQHWPHLPCAIPPEHHSALTVGGAATQSYTLSPKIILLDQTAVTAATALRQIPKLQAPRKY